MHHFGRQIAASAATSAVAVSTAMQCSWPAPPIQFRSWRDDGRRQASRVQYSVICDDLVSKPTPFSAWFSGLALLNRKGTTRTEAVGQLGPPSSLTTMFSELRPSCASVFAMAPEVAASIVAGAHTGDANVLDQLRQEDVRFIGSGFSYGSEGFLVTCAHLFESHFAERFFAVRFGDGAWCLAELQGASFAADVAVLRLLGQRRACGRVLFLSRDQILPQQGDWVAVCGCTQHGTETVGVAGVVSQPRQALHGLAVDAPVHFVQVALPTLPGMSGSPVVSSDGKVVGMLEKKFEEHGLALPAAWVAAVAHHLESGRAWCPPVLGLVLAPGGSPREPRVVIRSVARGGAAEIAGLQAGDELLAVEGMQVATMIDVQEALLALGGKWAVGGTGSEGSTSIPVQTCILRGKRQLDIRVMAPLSPPSRLSAPSRS